MEERKMKKNKTKNKRKVDNEKKSLCPSVKFTPPEEEKVKEIARRQARKVEDRILKKLEKADENLFVQIVNKLNQDISVIIGNTMRQHLETYHPNTNVILEDDKTHNPSDVAEKGNMPGFTADVLIPTPAGDKYVSELVPGDLIYGPRGKHLVITKTGGYETPDHPNNGRDLLAVGPDTEETEPED